MRRRSFLLRAAGLAAVVGGGFWLKDNLLWPAPDILSGPEGTGWLPLASSRAMVPMVAVEVAGRRITALLDTGAQYSVMDRALVETLDLGRGFDLPLIAYGVGGQAQAGRGVSLDVRIGRMSVRGLRTGVLDLGPLASADGGGVQMVLGQDLFGETVMELDPDGGRVRLIKAAGYRPPSEMIPALVSRKGTALMTEVSVEGAVIEAVVDTGFSGLLALSTVAAQQAGLLDGREEVAGSSLVLGGTAPARIIRVETLTFDRQIWRGVQVQVFGDSPLPNYPDALLGMGAFEGRRLALDLGRGQLFQSGELDLTIG